MADTKISGATVLTGTGLISSPVARAGSTTAYRRVDNLSATADPTTGDDANDGFHVGSLWLRSDNGNAWHCASATAGAAVWVRVGSGGPWLANRSWDCAFAGAFSNASLSAFGAAPTSTGTAAGSNSWASTNERTRRKRVPFRTGTSAGSGAGYRSADTPFARGGASGRRGFLIFLRFALVTLPASWRAFVGVSTSGAIGDVDPSSLTNLVGIGKDNADTAWQIMHNDGSGTATKAALNSTDFPITANTILDVILSCPPGDAQSVTYLIRQVSGQDANGNDTFASGAVSGVLASDLPAVDTQMRWNIWINNHTNSADATIDTMRVYYESYGD